MRLISTRRSCIALALLIGMASGLAAQRPPIRLDAAGQIGCTNCGEPIMLARVHALAATADRIYVLDGVDPYVRVFDFKGRLIRAFGRRGDGPGEFRFPMHLHVRDSGELDVFDYGSGRITRVDSLGTPLSSRLVNAGQFSGFCEPN